MFSWYHYLIVLVPLVAVCAFAVHSRKFVRGVADFLAAGRCAGRYLLRSGGMMANTSAVSYIAYTEIHCANGWMYAFWNSVLTPIGIVMTFYGWISYRFRETRAMSAGQFFEMRYSRGFRRLAAAVRGSADLLSNCIGPAVAVRFLIYLLGLPFRFTLLGHEFRTFPFLLAVCLSLALLMILSGGRVSLLVTDSIQGLVSYPIFFVLVVFVISRFSFWDEIAPVLADRVPGESFINPYDIQNLRDFNFFGLVVALMHRILGGAWIGNGYATVARSAHEGRMANVIAFFGAGMSGLLPVVLAMAALVVMNHANHAGTAREIRCDLVARVSDELVVDKAAGAAVGASVAAVPEQRHVIGVDPPLSQARNLETPTLEAVHGALLDTLPEAEANAAYEGFRATYRQQTLPLVLRHVAPPWIISLVVLLILLLVVSTDDTRIFDTTTSWMQDFILPFFRKPPSPRLHIGMFKGLAVAIGVFFWCGSYFFAQLDYISMFVTIFTSIWVAGAGAVVTLGLYWRRGTTAGAYSAILSGGGISLAAILIKRNWAAAVYPWLAAHGLEAGVRRFLEVASSPFVPWVDWRVSDALWPVKFPVNSIEISFIAGLTAVLLYVAVSLLTCREPFDLDRMLHRASREKEGAAVQQMKGRASREMEGAAVQQMEGRASREMEGAACAANSFGGKAPPSFSSQANPSLPPKAAPSLPAERAPSLLPKAAPSLPAGRAPSLPAGRAPSLLPKAAPSLPAGRAPSLPSKAAPSFDKARPAFAKRLLDSLVGITPEFTRGDRIIAWVAFVKHMVIDWIVLFLLCSIAAKAFGWGVREWTMRAFVVWIAYPLVVNTLTTVWFTWGTVRDLKQLFRDLSERTRNDLDNGMVEGHVSLADKR